MMATIRPMSPADYPAVAAIAADGLARGLVTRPAWESAADVAAEIDSLQHAAFIVAEDENDGVVGLAGYRLEHGEAVLYGPLVAVEGHGIGAWLASRIEAMARQQGAASCSMLIGIANRSGAAWAEWRGYQRDDEHPEVLYLWLNPGEMPAGQGGGSAVVRAAAAGDLARIGELYEEAYPAGRITPADWASLLPQCRVVEADGAVQGFLRLEPGTTFISELCVAPGVRRRGLGSQLVAETIRHLWAAQPVRVGAAAPLDNAGAVALFRRLGFQREVAVAKWLKLEG